MARFYQQVLEEMSKLKGAKRPFLGADQMLKGDALAMKALFIEDEWALAPKKRKGRAQAKPDGLRACMPQSLQGRPLIALRYREKGP